MGEIMAEGNQQQPVMHEAADISVRGVVWGGLTIFTGIVLAIIAAYFLWQWWNQPSGAQAFGGPNTGNLPQVAPPVLESAPQPERARYLAEKQKLLNSWGWIDRRAGIARIPLDDSMRIMAARGGQNGKNTDTAAPKEQR